MEKEHSTESSNSFTELIPGFPEEIAVECFSRLHYTAHGVAAGACRRWRDLVLSRDLYYYRKEIGQTRKLACLVQSLVRPGLKPVTPLAYGVTVFDPVSGSWDRLEPVPGYPAGLPLFCQLASSEGRLVVMGGWDPASYEPVRDVFVYDLSTRVWRRGKEMPSKRSFFAIGAVGGRVYVAGGHDECKNAVRTAWVYDLRKDEWAELAQMSQERDECEGVVARGEFWVVSGFRTESQGMFDGSAESYDFESGEWRRVDGVWAAGECPRSCVGVGKDGKFVSWAKSDSAIRVGPCGIDLGDRSLITGSEYQGAANGVYIVEGQNGKNKKWEKINVPEEFCGFVQSGCCVEI